MIRPAATVLFACLAITTPATADNRDPNVPRALAELRQFGTPAYLLQRPIAATPAITGIELHADGIIRLSVHTRGQPRAHVWEPLYLEDRVRLRAEIDAVPEAGVYMPETADATIELSVVIDSLKGSTAVLIDMPRITRGRIEQTTDLTTFHLAADTPIAAIATPTWTQRYTQAADIASAWLARVGTPAQWLAAARPVAGRWVATASAVTSGILASVRTAADTIVSAVPLERFASARPHLEVIAVMAVAGLLGLLIVLRLRRRRTTPMETKAAPDAWVVSTLAAKGGTVRDIAAQTRLPREAVALLMRTRPGSPQAAKRSASGRNFPVGMRGATVPLGLAS